MAGRSEMLFKIGVGFYLAGLAAAIVAVIILSGVTTLSVTNPARAGSIALVVAVGLMGIGWILRRNTRGG